MHTADVKRLCSVLLAVSGICRGSGAPFSLSGQIVLASSGQLRAQNTENIRYSCGPKILRIYGTAASPFTGNLR